MSVHLFPHFHLSKPILQKILSCFAPLTIFQPWYWEPSDHIETYVDRGEVKLRRPPESLKPGDDFEILLSEYSNWIERNQDRSYREILKMQHEGGLTEETTWEIRQMMNRMSHPVSDPKQDRTFRWHLLLHLAGRIEAHHRAADRMLKTLRERRPLLEGSIERVDPVSDLLHGLSLFDPDILLDEANLARIMESWFGLFGEFLKEHDTFITIDRHIMEYVSEEWDSLNLGENAAPESAIRFIIPDCFNLDEVRRKKIKTLIMEPADAPDSNRIALGNLSKELSASFGADFPGKGLRLTVRYIEPLREGDQRRASGEFRQCAGKTIVLVEEN